MILPAPAVLGAGAGFCWDGGFDIHEPVGEAAVSTGEYAGDFSNGLHRPSSWLWTLLSMTKVPLP
ncbi:hypothetical protein Rhal01_02950 [Rubritalea halochordaticola]|uniref:Uncharacterized protein n=1 Tax=Rubritalea halochordaticola TaxID=714537 RepID=A0ABP9V423_9BACT